MFEAWRHPLPLTLCCAVAGLTAAGCGGADEAPDASLTEGRAELDPANGLMIFDTIQFTPEEPPGTAPGFNLDERISPVGDPDSCGHPDLTSPGGAEGIDNQFASLVNLFESVGLGPAEGLIQSSIVEGGILLMLELSGIDDSQEDPELLLRLRTGFGVPLVGTDGQILAGQTFHLHPDSPDTAVHNGRISDGILHAGPFQAFLPVSVLGATYTLTVHGARIRARLTEDGGIADGLMGGGVSLADLYGIGEVAARDDAGVLRAIEIIVAGAGDLAQDEAGECQQISSALAFTAVSGFLFQEDEAPAPSADVP